jgi:hypothetical protein
MPVRRDLTGYTYELEGWGGPPLSGVFLETSSPTCMTERVRCRRDEKNKSKNYGEAKVLRGIGGDKQPWGQSNSGKQIKSRLFVSGRKQSRKGGGRS